MNAMAKMANRQSVEENFNEITNVAPCKVAKLTKSGKSRIVQKFTHGFVEFSNWIPKVAPWGGATSTKNEEFSISRK